MNKMQRIRDVLLGLIMILGSLVMALVPGDGLKIALGILGISLFVMGIRYIVYYRTMARHMIGGRSILIIGVILLDFSLLTASMQNVPLAYIVVYLLGIYAFSGVIDILGAFEAKGYGATSWRFKLATGIINVLIALAALLCGLILRSHDDVVYIYCAGLFYSGLTRIITAFRKTAIVYIQ